MHNKSSETPYTVKGSLRLESVLYTGKERGDVKDIEFVKELPPNTIEIVEMEVTFNEYFKRLLDQVRFVSNCA